jgi:RHH-type proline utilization regulon transcriptional repressor/proline dehydrogenase/delta 1-pyrroline-5-carboxylate dehydrogenase
MLNDTYGDCLNRSSTSIPVGSQPGGSLEERTQAIGRVLAERVRHYRPTPVEAAGDQAMVLLASAPRFRSHLLRFVDALAGLDGDRSGRRTAQLMREYLDGDFLSLPSWLVPFLSITTNPIWPPPVVAAVARQVTRTVARRFISSGGPQAALDALHYLRSHHRYPSFDVLGEYVASEHEADRYRDQYLALLQTLSRSPVSGRRTAGGAYALQVSVKLSSLTADFNPVDPEGTYARVRPRLAAIIAGAVDNGIGVTLDMERYETRDLVLRIFFEEFGPGGMFSHWDGIGVVLQAYLRDSGETARELTGFAGRRGVPFQIRLVKGAYWDYETIVAQENDWPVPVWEEKWQTDEMFERLSEELISVFPRVWIAIASHNIRSHARAEAVREASGLPRGSVEHQTLFRTAEGITRALASMGWPVRDYVPLGELLPGMAYLVRRILENSSQAGFLLHSRAGDSLDQLLAPPGRTRPDTCDGR